MTVASVGDFAVGQGVMLGECRPQIRGKTIWGPRRAVAWGRPLQSEAELRGYDGSQGDWLILLLDVPEGTNVFRWSDDLARTWHAPEPIGGDWQVIRDGLEVRFNPFAWEKGYTVVFSCRAQLVSTIERIEGRVVTLREAPTRTVRAAPMGHCDDAALQAAIDRAIAGKQNLRVPVGHYLLSRGLVVRNPTAFTMEGGNAVDTVLDISSGEGACISLNGGIEATLRQFTMVGHSGFEERDQCGLLPMLGSSYFWGYAAKNCNAVNISNTQRVLVENCHGRRMAAECFVSSGRSRGELDRPDATHTQSTIYFRCSATDCGRNAFNDVRSGSENTTVTECRIVDVGAVRGKARRVLSSSSETTCEMRGRWPWGILGPPIETRRFRNWVRVNTY